MQSREIFLQSKKNMPYETNLSQPELIRSKILHKTEEKQHSLLEVYQYHNDQFEKLVGLEYSLGTFKKFKSASKSLEAFIEWKFNKKDVYLIRSTTNSLLNMNSI